MSLLELETGSRRTYVKTPLELAIAAQLDEDELVDQEADQVEGLRHVRAVVAVVCHVGR